LVKRLINALESVQVEYMFTGAIASSYYGMPRTTMDVDLVLAISRLEMTYLVEALREIGLVVSTGDFEKALETGYNIVSFDDSLSPYSVDFILLEGTLERVSCTLFGESTYMQNHGLCYRLIVGLQDQRSRAGY